MSLNNNLDVRAKIARTHSQKSHNVDALYTASVNIASYFLRRLDNPIYKELMQIPTYRFAPNGDPAEGESLIKELVFLVLSKTRKHIFVKRFDVNHTTITRAEELTDALADINKIFDDIIIVDFSDDHRYEGFMYFCLKNKIEQKESDTIVII